MGNNGRQRATDAVGDEAQGTAKAPQVSERVYSNNDDFGKTLNAALDKQSGKDKTVLAQVDGPAGPPEIVDNSKDNKVIGTEMKDGKVVREHMQHGADVIVSYDDKGNAHRTTDHPITKLPVDMSEIPEWRNQQLTKTADGLIRNYTDGKTPSGLRDGRLSFNDISNIMKDISKMPDLTETEKCKLWSNVREQMQKNSVPILDADEKKEMIDSWKGSDDPWHAILHMGDGYHADKLINMSPEAASKAIIEHEDGAETKDMPLWRSAVWNTAHFLLGRNTGDVNASEGQLKALRELRSKGTFSAYANEWTEQFVRKDRDQYGRPR